MVLTRAEAKRALAGVAHLPGLDRAKGAIRKVVEKVIAKPRKAADDKEWNKLSRKLFGLTKYGARRYKIKKGWKKALHARSRATMPCKSGTLYEGRTISKTKGKRGLQYGPKGLFCRRKNGEHRVKPIYKSGGGRTLREMTTGGY